MSNVRWISKEEALERWPSPASPRRIEPVIQEDGKEYYVAYLSSHAYRYLKPDYWQDALDQAKRQLAKLRSH